MSQHSFEPGAGGGVGPEGQLAGRGAWPGGRDGAAGAAVAAAWALHQGLPECDLRSQVPSLMPADDNVCQVERNSDASCGLQPRAQRQQIPDVPKGLRA